MIRKPINPGLRMFLGVSSIVVLISIYFYLSYNQHVLNPKDTTIPNFHQLIEGIIKVTTHDSLGKIWIIEDFLATFSRLFYGLSLGVIISVFLGLLMGCFSTIEAFFLTPLNFLSKIPPTAMMAVFFVLFGTNTSMFIAMISFGVIPILTQTVYQAAKYDVPEELIYKSYTLGASQAEVIFELIFAYILPKVIESIRLQVGPALIYLIAAEMMVADIGFGYRLRIQSRLLNMNVVYIYLLILGIIGYTIDWIFVLVRKTICCWHEIK